jgi:hypothetical protein
MRLHDLEAGREPVDAGEQLLQRGAGRWRGGQAEGDLGLDAGVDGAGQVDRALASQNCRVVSQTVPQIGAWMP